MKFLNCLDREANCYYHKILLIKSFSFFALSCLFLRREKQNVPPELSPESENSEGTLLI